jgi:hypothetical protein
MGVRGRHPPVDGALPASVHHARVIGRCEDTTGIVQFAGLVDQAMPAEP